MSNIVLRKKIIDAGYKAIKELIKVAEEPIIEEEDDFVPGIEEDEDMVAKAQTRSLSADRLKNAAATKKISITDAFDILSRIEEEEENLRIMSEGVSEKDIGDGGFADKRSK